MKFGKEFKEAISNLPSKEKDKLIFRLLKKDLVLANRLLFELIDSQTVDERRDLIEGKVINYLTRYNDFFYKSPDNLVMELREISGMINEHVTITKDKFGEISLNLLMLNKALEFNISIITERHNVECYKLCTYIAARIFKVLGLMNMLHEDYILDFKEDMKKLGMCIIDNDYLTKNIKYHGLDINWLLTAEFPDNMKEIQRDLRKEGFLR